MVAMTTGLFESYDTGSNNSNSSSSAADINLPPTWHNIPPGIPSHCYCGEVSVVKTQTRGAHQGRRFYSCSSPMDDGECHIYRLWDDAVMEELVEVKKRVTEVEDRLSEWIGSPEYMSPPTMWELFHSCKEQKQKLTELVKSKEKAEEEIIDLKETVKQLQIQVFEEDKGSEEKTLLRRGFVLYVITLIVNILIFKYFV